MTTSPLFTARRQTLCVDFARGVIGLLSLLTFGAGPLSAADFGMTWLPLPEAYTWPAPLPGAGDFKPQPVATESLSAAIQAMLKKTAAGEVLPATVEVDRADLNADGEAEWIVSVPPLSGLGGQVYLLMQSTPQGLVRLGLIHGHLSLLKAESGWVQIACLTKGGEGRFVRALWQFHEGAYHEVRQEAHDFLTRRVEVTGKETGR